MLSLRTQKHLINETNTRYCGQQCLMFIK
uniref:Uncharacterized protein n=1 Tax=Arundo donax TaxID=35708 RepID=A0A0A9CCL0_ARUDO